MDEAIRRATRMVSDHEEVLAEIKRTSANGLQGVQDEYRNLEVCENPVSLFCSLVYLRFRIYNVN